MGTPDFAVASLDAIVKAGINVKAVITATDKPAGRGQKVQYSAVKKYAVDQNIPVLQPDKLRNETFLAELESYKADLFVVVAFRMLPKLVWDMPPLGTINLHGSLLPQYRGAAPINWAVINGEKETGVTTFFIEEEIDTGKVIENAKIEVAETDTAGIVHDKLMVTGAELLVKTVSDIFNNKAEAVNQKSMFASEKELKHAPKIFKPDCKIAWDKPSIEIYNLIRGLSPYPAAFAEFDNGKKKVGMKIFEATYSCEDHDLSPGTITVQKKGFTIATTDGFISPTIIQPAGKKRMEADAFTRGTDISEWKTV